MIDDQKKIKAIAREIREILYILADELPNLSQEDALSYTEEVARQVGVVHRVAESRPEGAVE